MHCGLPEENDRKTWLRRHRFRCANTFALFCSRECQAVSPCGRRAHTLARFRTYWLGKLNLLSFQQAADIGKSSSFSMKRAILTRASIPVLEPGPVLRVAALAVAQPEVVMMLVVHDPWGVKGAQIDDLSIVAGVVFGVIAEGEDGLACVVVPTPEEVVLMAADGGRQTVPRAENVDGAGFPVVIAEDGGAGANVRRERVVSSGEPLHHLRPAEAVGEYLRQRAGELFKPGGIGVEGSGVDDVLCRRQNCEYGGAGGQTQHDDEADGVGGKRPIAAGELGKGRGPSGEEDGINGREVVILAVHEHHDAQKENIGESDEAPATGGAGEGEPSQPANPKRSGKDKQNLNLFQDERQGRKLDVFIRVGNGAEELVGGKLIGHLPQEVGHGDKQEEDDAGGASLGEKDAALRAEQEPDQQRGEKEDGGMLVFNSQARQNTKVEPSSGSDLAFSDAQDDKQGTHPEARLERVHGEIV